MFAAIFDGQNKGGIMSKLSWKQELPQSLHFVGVAGTGMSALAQFTAWHGLRISGSDRQFAPGQGHQQLQDLGIVCTDESAAVLDELKPGALVISTAIEATHPQLLWAQSHGVPLLHRSELLEILVRGFRSIAVGGTSGKSTTTAMIFHILRRLGADPSVITGAGLCDLEKQGLIGNAWAGRGDWLVVEADESDGTVERYRPEIGLLLNIDRDHKELDELQKLFAEFRAHTQGTFISWRGSERTRALSANQRYDFGDDPNCGFYAKHVEYSGLKQKFQVQGHPCVLPIPGDHNRDNALGALAAVHAAGFDLAEAAAALSDYPGIHRRFQIMHQGHEFVLVDDFAHNPAKIAAALRAAQGLSPVVHAWFQPHGFAPTRFMREELMAELAQILRPSDSMSFGEIYYAGGTATKDICSQDLVDDLCRLGQKSELVPRENLAEHFRAQLKGEEPLLLIMGARDPSLAAFSKQVLGDLLR